MLTRSLRLSGFLLALSPEDLKLILMLLTFVTANGHCAAPLPQLASALHLSFAKTRTRMKRILALRWLGQPLVLSYQPPGGLETFVFAPGFLPLYEEQRISPPPLYRPAGRQTVIEYSRSTYARPRAEVERQIAQLNEWKLSGDEADSPQPVEPEDPEKTATRRELLNVGLQLEQANELLKQFDLIRIRRQLMWLPYRTARNRAGYLLAAIKDDYAAPIHLRRVAKPPEDEG